MRSKVYLGDGVYAQQEEATRTLILTTEDGVRVTNQIYLEPEVLLALYEFLAIRFYDFPKCD